MTDTDVDTLAALADADAPITRLTAPATPPLAIPGRVRVTDRLRPGSGGVRVTLAWSSGLRGHTAPTEVGGHVRHARLYTAPGADCPCARQSCGGITPAPWCPDHGTAAAPAMEWHPAGGIRCAHLARRS